MPIDLIIDLDCIRRPFVLIPLMLRWWRAVKQGRFMQEIESADVAEYDIIVPRCSHDIDSTNI